jgi:hypothetical protein
MVTVETVDPCSSLARTHLYMTVNAALNEDECCYWNLCGTPCWAAEADSADLNSVVKAIFLPVLERSIWGFVFNSRNQDDDSSHGHVHAVGESVIGCVRVYSLLFLTIAILPKLPTVNTD